MFYTKLNSPTVQVSVANYQLFIALYKLECAILLINDPKELRKLITSVTNIYTKANFFAQHRDIMKAESDLMLKINTLENQ
jgi:hypothetical protein